MSVVYNSAVVLLYTSVCNDVLTNMHRYHATFNVEKKIEDFHARTAQV